MILRRRQLSAHQVALQLDKPAAPVDVAPLQCQELGSQSRSQSAKQPRMPFWKVLPCDLDHVSSLMPREWIDAGFRLVSTPKILPH